MSDKVEKISDSIGRVRISNNAPPQQPTDFHSEILHTRELLRRRYEAQKEEERRLRDAEREKEEAAKRANKARIISQLRQNTAQSLATVNQPRTPTLEEVAAQQEQLRKAIASRARHWRATRSEELFKQSEMEAARFKLTAERLAREEDRKFKEQLLARKEEEKRKAFDNKLKEFLDASREERKAAVVAEIENEEHQQAVLMMNHFKHREILENDQAQLQSARSYRLHNSPESPTHRPKQVKSPTAEASAPREKNTKEIDWRGIIQKSLSVNDKKIIAGEMMPTNLGEFAMWKRHTDGRYWHSLNGSQQYDEFKEYKFITGQWEPTSSQKKWLEERRQKKQNLRHTKQA